jgi:hypothetical protein
VLDAPADAERLWIIVLEAVADSIRPRSLQEGIAHLADREFHVSLFGHPVPSRHSEGSPPPGLTQELTVRLRDGSSQLDVGITGAGCHLEFIVRQRFDHFSQDVFGRDYLPDRL